MIYKIAHRFLTPLVFVLLLCTGLLSSQTHAALILQECGQGSVAIVNDLQVYQDTSAKKTLADIQLLDQHIWQPIDKTALAPGFSRSAYWYRTAIDNQSQESCRFWLNFGTTRVADIQMYTQQDSDDWQYQHVGVAHPFKEWASTQRSPSFPVVLEPASIMHIHLRLSSPHAFAIEPQLLSEQAFIQARMSQGLFDGIAFGVLGLLIILSLILGYFYRLPVLIVLALAVFAYTAYTVLLAGYGFIFLWPQSVQFNANIVMTAHIMTRILILAYLYVLLQVKHQLKYIPRLIIATQIGLVALLVLRFVFPDEQWLDAGGALNYIIRLGSIAMMLAAVYTGIRHKLAYTWFGYAVLLLMLSQSTLLLLSSLGVSAMRPLEFAGLLVSSLPGAFLLSYTLVNQIALGRKREKCALADMEQLKGAEQETLEQRVELRTQQLRNTLQHQNMLLARISHDLRSPLQHVIRDARLLQISVIHAARYGHNIERAVQQQLDLIDELLEFSHGELKQLELLIAPGYFFGFLREIEESGLFLAERNANGFRSDLANDLPLLVNADFRRLRQVIINLLANATKFTHKGQIEFAVNLSHQDKHAGHVAVQFAVIDNGIGMPSEERHNLLQPFQRGLNSVQYEGVGLGLYIVRQLLDSMDSELLIKESSSGGVHCQFTVTLELASEHELEQVFIESYAASSEGGQHTVLIVDDVEITQEMLYELLCGYNYNPITCGSAAEALIILRDNPIDIVITDQVMPVMDGWDLLRNVRKEWPQLPIMLYSARPPVRPLDLPLAVDFDACLLKPAATGDLLAQISSLLSADTAI